LSLRICLAGATGHVGRELAAAILTSADLELCAAVGRRGAGQKLGAGNAEVPVHATLSAALAGAGAQVMIDYTHPEVVKDNVRVAVEAGCHVVIGTSGLSDEDYVDIDRWAQARRVGVFAAGNFSITAALLQHFALQVAQHMPHWEILDYASDTKPDAPSGTARELAFQIGRVTQPQWAVPVTATQGLKESRGATLNGSQLHSIRVPGFYSAVEVIFGESGERIELRHESNSYAPYVAGTLLAARKVSGFAGLKRGMPSLLGL
jgi:4-hydroxy-tetrahydrodipicolinate reductase